MMNKTLTCLCAHHEIGCVPAAILRWHVIAMRVALCLYLQDNLEWSLANVRHMLPQTITVKVNRAHVHTQVLIVKDGGMP